MSGLLTSMSALLKKYGAYGTGQISEGIIKSTSCPNMLQYGGKVPSNLSNLSKSSGYSTMSWIDSYTSYFTKASDTKV